MKASPLLRAWMARLGALGVRLLARHRWLGFSPDGAARFATPDGEQQIKTSATILALGGASWPRLGSDGVWPALLPGIATRPFAPSNMGFAISWSDHLRQRFAGTPLKRIALSFGGITQRGEAMITEAGIEGGAVYALSAALRDALARQHSVTLHLDLRPDLNLADLNARLAGRRGSLSLSNHLRRNAGLPPVGIALVQEALKQSAEALDLAGLIKALPLRVTSRGRSKPDATALAGRFRLWRNAGLGSTDGWLFAASLFQYRPCGWLGGSAACGKGLKPSAPGG
jgi:uncharacterized flavoprotein (TIGR03862 family)